MGPLPDGCRGSRGGGRGAGGCRGSETLSKTKNSRAGPDYNVILVGRPSTGKTTVARAIGHAACSLGRSVYSGSMVETLEMLRAGQADGTYRKAFRRIASPDLLILDDAGFGEVNRDLANELFRLVCARHRQRSIVLVTNLPFKQWGEFLPAPAQAVAIADRLVDDATILRFTGKPYRQPRDIHGASLDGE